jgi:hypothetical protein
LSSNYVNLNVTAQQGTLLSAYNVNHVGPCFLSTRILPAHYSSSGLSNAEQELWTQGAAAVKAARPNKPSIDLPVTLGELRTLGNIPVMFGSILGRSKTVLDVFRNGGKEYLNAQFGWAPLIRDVTALAELVHSARGVLEQYDRDIERLVRRRYHFPDVVDVNNTLTNSPASGSYSRMAGTPYGGVPEDHLSFKPTTQVPEQINRTTVKTGFSGGFRVYHRSVPEALQELSLFEEKANLLLGTRLDPEILWNLAPWTWLADWFVNFGDVVANASALLSDDLVMQYGYLMRTTTIESEVSWPQGLWYQRPTGLFSSVWTRTNKGPFVQTSRRVIKQRGKASPFGFGLTPAGFSPQQWLILGALGISRV